MGTCGCDNGTVPPSQQAESSPVEIPAPPTLTLITTPPEVYAASVAEREARRHFWTTLLVVAVLVYFAAEAL